MRANNRAVRSSARAGLLCLAALLAVLGFASCGAADEGPDNRDRVTNEAPVTITIAYAMGDSAHRRGLQTVINDFKKSHLNVQIVVADESPQARGYADQLTLLDAKDMFPDLVEMRDTQMFADAGLLAELPEDIAYLFDDIPKVNGSVYTAPLKAGTPQGIIYNKKIFRELGLEEPEDYGQFLAICERLKKEGVYPLVVGGKDLWHMGFWTNHFLLDYVYSADVQWNRKRSSGTASWTDPGPTAAIRELKALWDNGYIVPGFMNISDSQTINHLISGEAAMLMSGPWMFKQLEQADPSFETGFFPVPDRDGRIRILGLPEPTGWAVSAAAAEDSEKLKYIKQFLHFFYGKEEYPKYLEAVSAVPATKETVPYSASELVLEVEQLIRNPEAVKLYSMEHYWGEDRIPPGFRNELYAIVQNVLSGQLTVEQAMEQADEAWENRIDEK